MNAALKVRVEESGATAPHLETEAGPFGVKLHVGQIVELFDDDGLLRQRRVYYVGRRIYSERGIPRYVLVDLEGVAS